MVALAPPQNGQGEPGQTGPARDEPRLPIGICPTDLWLNRVLLRPLVLELPELPYLIVPLFENLQALALHQRMNSQVGALD